MKPLSHEVAETGRIQVGARANDAVTGETAELPGHIGKDVHWKAKRDEVGQLFSILRLYFKATSSHTSVLF